MGFVVIDPMPYVTLLTTIDVLRFVAVLAIALLSWVAFARTHSSVFAFTAAGFSAMLLGIVSRHLALVEFNRNALCLGCLGLGSFYAYFYVSITLMVLGASLVALAYVKRFSWLAVGASALLLLAAIRLALVSVVSYATVLAFIFGFIALRVVESMRRTKRSALTAVAFALLSVSFILESFVYAASWVFPFAEIIGLAGFVLLAYVLVRVWVS